LNSCFDPVPEFFLSEQDVNETLARNKTDRGYKISLFITIKVKFLITHPHPPALGGTGSPRRGVA